MSRPSSVTFRGKRWRVVYRKQKDSYGKCEHPRKPGKTLYLDPAMFGQVRLYLAIHEGLHGCLWDLDEEAVTETATDLSNWLWRLGLRFEDEAAVDIGPEAERLLRTDK